MGRGVGSYRRRIVVRFLIKGGAVSVLVRGERTAGPIEQPPLLPDVIARASAFSVDAFIEGARALFHRYARLGLILIGGYLASGLAFVGVVSASRSAGEGWAMTALVTVAFVAWITIINLLYLLMQIVIAAETVGDVRVLASRRSCGASADRSRRSSWW